MVELTKLVEPGRGNGAPPLRFERKFLTGGLGPREVLPLIHSHPALFREVYPERAVNNLYLDTPGLRHYFEHVHGTANRVKIRVRWYGPLAGRIERPMLEYKLKRGLVGGKISQGLPACATDGSAGRGFLPNLREADGVPEAARHTLRGLEPTLVNRYRRRYFLSADRHFRLTLDWGLEFYSPHRVGEGRGPLPEDIPPVVIELKFDVAVAGEADAISNAFPFRLTRCSKYVLGIEALHHG